MSYKTQLANNWAVAIDCEATRRRIMMEALEAITFRGSGQAVREAHPPTEGKYGFRGVDKWSPKAEIFRARISLWDCSNGQWVRIGKNGFASAEEAGFWYVCAHIAFWGSLSVHADEVSVEVYEALVGEIKATRLAEITANADKVREIDATDFIVPIEIAQQMVAQPTQ